MSAESPQHLAEDKSLYGGNNIMPYDNSNSSNAYGHNNSRSNNNNNAGPVERPLLYEEIKAASSASSDPCEAANPEKRRRSVVVAEMGISMEKEKAEGKRKMVCCRNMVKSGGLGTFNYTSTSKFF